MSQVFPKLVYLGNGPVDNYTLVKQPRAEAAAKRLKPIGQTFPLAKPAEAHTAIEALTTIGKTLLKPVSAYAPRLMVPVLARFVTRRRLAGAGLRRH